MQKCVPTMLSASATRGAWNQHEFQLRYSDDDKLHVQASNDAGDDGGDSDDDADRIILMLMATTVMTVMADGGDRHDGAEENHDEGHYDEQR